VELAPPQLGVEGEPESVHRPDWEVNRLVEADCLAAMAQIPDHSVHLVLCDLPYGTTANPWDSVVPLDALWEQYRRVVHPDGVVVLTGQGPFTARLILSNEAWFKYKLCWIKSKPTNFLNSSHQPLRRHEDICIFARKRGRYFAQMQAGAAYDKGVRKDQQTGSYGTITPSRVQTSGARHPTDVVYFKTAESEGPVWHPTQKPVALGRYLVRTHSLPGEVVLDNAFGSGSFLLAALLEGRNYYGIERNAESRLFREQPTDFVKVASERLAQARVGLGERQAGWLAGALPRGA
jgi:site-specific DNA-methyltransferase (adenine-specific)/modification methylase